MKIFNAEGSLYDVIPDEAVEGDIVIFSGYIDTEHFWEPKKFNGKKCVVVRRNNHAGKSILYGMKLNKEQYKKIILLDLAGVKPNIILDIDWYYTKIKDII